ncbi:MAG: outer membrane protein assembly factor BamA [Flavobacteriales bacterium]|nr:outer membrane protein assembly factor BamA [Flavobacteriales bacterium]MBK6755964.1 outer membrane protein assembly factor BamA [Flavobacteriales bacterium]MBK7752042.1 outer membrane protein assembly factor BamA [Flavobacteriales bacterium]
MKVLSLVLIALGAGLSALAQQPMMDPALARDYEIGGLTVSGTTTVDVNAVMLFSGLKVGEKVLVPGPRIADAIKNIWDQKLFSDVRVEAAEIRGGTIFLNIVVTEKPRLSRFKFEGITKSDADKLREQLQLVRGQQVNEALLSNTRSTISRYYVDKGFMKADAVITQTNDTLMENSVLLVIDVRKGKKVRIKDVRINGNEALSDAKVRRSLKKTRRKNWYNPFGASKFIAKTYRVDKENLINEYNEAGYRNATIVRDTTYFVNDRKLMVEIDVEEGNKFYFREIYFTGNTKHTDRELLDILNIKRGDVYNKTALDSRMYMNQSGRDISSLYMDDGYLSFYPEVVEVAVGDSIDLDIRIREGKQYRIRNVIIKGNTKTNEHVIRREIRTKPGQLFNRSDVLRTQRELANLGYFDPEKLGVNPVQDARTGTVDLEYTVEEKPSDRLELSGGWGAGRLVLSLGLSFTNFSMRNIAKPSAWQPLPAGDGQTLNLRAQTNGRFFQSYSMSFVEPWLGGHKQNSLSLSVFHSVQTNGKDKFINTDDGKVANPERQSLLITGGSVGLGKRLPWPDDYFLLRQSINYQLYDLRNWTSLFSFSNGQSNVLSYQISISRNSVDAPFFARSGSDVTLSLKATPPYSWFQPGRDWASEEPATRYQWAEFHKWKFSTQWFTRITRTKSGHDLVLMTRAGFGFLGRYNANLGNSPFERFFLGGSALTGFQLDGREIVGLRGYDDLSLAPRTGNFLINKYTTELRFPISLNPSATIFALTFLEAGNTWSEFDKFDPFSLYRSAGIGLRLFLPMFGPMGLDYGWRFDDLPDQPQMAKGQFHFTIGIDLGEL